jgi:hypothetical protein
MRYLKLKPDCQIDEVIYFWYLFISKYIIDTDIDISYRF